MVMMPKHDEPCLDLTAGTSSRIYQRTVDGKPYGPYRPHGRPAARAWPHKPPDRTKHLPDIRKPAHAKRPRTHRACEAVVRSSVKRLAGYACGVPAEVPAGAPPIVSTLTICAWAPASMRAPHDVQNTSSSPIGAPHCEQAREADAC